MIESWDDELKAKRAASDRFCPTCGTAHEPEDAFCRKCGRSFTTSVVPRGTPVAAPAPATAATAAVVAGGPATPAPSTATTLAGAAWIAVALADGYLAYLQGTFAPIADDPASFHAAAAVNGFFAIVTVIFGALLLTGPTRGRLNASITWGVVSVLAGIYNVASGATHWAFFVALAGAGVAAALSYAARSSTTSQHAAA